MSTFNPKEPLWLPRGSIRGLIALVDTVSIVAMVFLGIDVPDWFAGQWATVIAFYFAGRSANGKE